MTGERIAAVGPTREVLARFPEKEAAQVLDAGGRLLAPGFVDAHTHLPFAGGREMEFDARARGESYEAIAARGGGIRASVRQLRAIPEDDLRAKVAVRLSRLLAQGDHHRRGEERLRALARGGAETAPRASGPRPVASR